MRSWILALIALSVATPVWAHTFSLSVVNNSTCGTGNSNHGPGGLAGYPDGSTCFENGLLDDTNVAVLNDTGADSDSGVGTLTLVNDFDINAAVAVDAFVANNEYQELNVSYDLTFTIDTDGPADPWTLTLDHDAMGLNALHGDGTLTAVGSQDNGHAHMSDVSVTGDVTDTLTTANNFNDNPSNTSQSSSAFSDSNTGIAVAAGAGDATVNVTIDLKLDAFSNDGCSGFICSSASGGEEAAVLFGVDDASGIGSVDVDEYSEWGRAVGPDGYNSTWSLSVIGVECGNGTTEGPEECDDGNMVSNDGCSDMCIIEFCSDGITQSGIGEQCDDGNLISGDGCDDMCQSEGVSVPSGSDTSLAMLIGLLLSAGALLALRGRSARA